MERLIEESFSNVAKEVEGTAASELLDKAGTVHLMEKLSKIPNVKNKETKDIMKEATKLCLDDCLDASTHDKYPGQILGESWELFNAFDLEKMPADVTTRFQGVILDNYREYNRTVKAGLSEEERVRANNEYFGIFDSKTPHRFMRRDEKAALNAASFLPENVQKSGAGNKKNKNKGKKKNKKK